ncbi:cytochrome c oxidase assembly protein [Pseudomonas saliphila]|uniref:cytochrome c oxidase assembly protein n=1 Tax=Pseudomonas saliphila TaxID=2586906 RepID=UPI00123BD476|nr:cytochrome c oxidase assembly protein [Pseudomonas saliphila]
MFAWLALGLIIALGAAYVGAAMVQWRAGRAWSLWRVASWLCGCLLLIQALAPGTMLLAHHDFRWHMAQHLVIGMLAPLALVLAAPITLLLRSLPVNAARWLTALLRSAYVRFISHPWVALVLNVGAMWLLYLTPLYLASLQSPWLHALVHIHFLLAGYLFCWSVLAGPDQAVHSASFRRRASALFLSIAAHSVLAKVMYGYGWPRNVPHDPEQIRAAAQLMYYGGDFAELLLAIALFAMAFSRHGAEQTEARAKA